MARNILKISTLALMAAVSTLSAAHAGGFARGSADTDIIFEDGNFNLRAGATVVMPTRKFTRGPGAFGPNVLNGTSYTSTYVIPSAALKLNISDSLRCAGTMSTPYGGAVSYASPTTSGKLREEFTINEFGATCGYKFDLSTGRAWIIGGIYQESFDYNRFNFRNATSRLNLNLDGTATGFRVGAAYEIPEFALRAQVMYRAASNYGATGTLAVQNLAGIPLLTVGAVGTGNLPQSFEFKLQSGVAADWLAFGSVKWTDWSVNKQLIVVTPLGTQTNDYFWRDGWTVNAGVGHKFSDSFSGAVSLTYDRSVGTGYTLDSDTWTLGAGGSLKDKLGGELKFGGGITYIGAAAETKNAPGTNTSVKSGVAYAFGASYGAKW